MIDPELEEQMKMLEGLSLDTVNFDSCANLREVRNLNLVASGSSSPFKNCVNLETLQGNLSLRDSISSAFYRCSKLSNIHNTLNLDLNKTIQSIKEFKGLEHRLEYVGVVDDVIYYNDSISTVPESTIKGIEALKDVNTLLVGGNDRGIDLSKLVNSVLLRLLVSILKYISL